MVQLRHLMFTAPDELRERYAIPSRVELTKPVAAEIDERYALIGGLVKQTAPDLLNVY